jgi:hypothetical protein
MATSHQSGLSPEVHFHIKDPDAWYLLVPHWYACPALQDLEGYPDVLYFLFYRTLPKAGPFSLSRALAAVMLAGGP